MIEEVDVAQGQLVYASPKKSKVRFVGKDEHHKNLVIRENNGGLYDIISLNFYSSRGIAIDILYFVYLIAKQFNVKKIIWRLRPTNVHTHNVAPFNAGMCYLIIDGKTNI